MKKLLALILACGIVMGLFGGAFAEENAMYEGSVTVALNADPIDLQPYSPNMQNKGFITNLVYESLFYYDDQGMRKSKPCALVILPSRKRWIWMWTWLVCV